MSRVTLPVFLLIIVGGVVGWLHFGSSGTFVCHGRNFTALLNLTQTFDGQVTGQYQQITLDNAGKLSTRLAAVSGTAELTSLGLTFKEVPFLPGDTVIGSFNGIRLTLTFLSNRGTPVIQVFEHSSLNEFNKYANELNHEANMIEANKEIYQAQKKEAEHREQFLKNVLSGVDQIEKENPKLEKFVSTIAPKIHGSFINTSNKMNSLLQRERGTPDSLTRSGLVVDINQGAIDTNLVSLDVHSLQQDYQNNIIPMVTRINILDHACYQYSGDQSIASACDKLRGIIPSFQNNIGAVKEALQSLEATYDAEKRKQDEIENESRRIQ